jgi:integrase
MAGKTIQEAFESYLEGNRSDDSVATMRRALKDLESAGFPPDSLISELNSEEGIAHLQKWATTERYDGVSAGAGNLASRVKTLITAGTSVDEVNVLANWEKTNRNTNKEFGIRLTRAARKLELPDFDNFNKAIDATARQIDDKEARAFFLIKMLTGLRNPDIINLKLGKAVKGAEYGSFDPSIQKIYALSNKGERINYDLGEVVHGILADLAADAEAEGRTTLFSRTGKAGERYYRGKINPVMNRNMDAMGLEIFDLNKGEAVPFSIRDLRKNIFDILDEEEGPGAANKVLGHSSGGDVGLKHYKVERTRRKSLSGLQRSQELFSSLYMESLGFDNPQILFGNDGYKFSTDKFNPSAVASISTGVSPDEQRIESRLQTTQARAERSIDATTESVSKRIKNLERLIDKASELETKAGVAKPAPAPKTSSIDPNAETPTINPEASSALKDKGFDAKGAADAFTRFFKGGKNKLSTAVSIGAGGLTVASLIDDASAVVRDVAMEAGALAMKAPAGVAGAIPMMLAPTEVESGTLYTDEELREQEAARIVTEDAGMDMYSETDEREMERVVTRDTGFVDIDRVPEAAPVDKDQGFLSR